VSQVPVTYFTDPACPRSWAAEPALARLHTEFGADVLITYVMGGLAREFDRPLAVLGEILQTSADSGMPADPRGWLDRPPRSSYPACLAVRAAAEQGLTGEFLRAARVALMCRRRRLDAPDALVELAREVPGLQIDRFAIDLASNAITESFGADLERWRTEHPEGILPVLAVGHAGSLAGAEISPDAVAELARRAGAGAVPLPEVESALRRLGPVAAVEVAAACGLPLPRAQAELWRLALEWRARPERVLAGELWGVG